MVRLIAAVALLLASHLVSANCLDRFYVVKGRVVNAQQEPVAGALVGASWVEAGAPAGPTMATSNQRGEFTLHLQFRPFVGIGRQGDICTDKLETISVLAVHGNAQSVAFQVKVRHPDTKPIRSPLLVLNLPRD